MKSIEDRFFSKVNKPEDPEKCWGWVGSKFDGGYGQLRIDGKNIGAHRVSALIHGLIPDVKVKDQVLHSCDNPSCTNPNHLFIGSHSDNMKDKSVKGRSSRISLSGESNPRSKLKESDVESIRAMRNSGARLVDIAAAFSISVQSVSDIALGKKWKTLIC